MTAQEQIAHGVAESFWVGQALQPGIDAEFAEMFYDTATVHAAAAWATSSAAEVIPFPVAENEPLSEIAAA